MSPSISIRSATVAGAVAVKTFIEEPRKTGSFLVLPGFSLFNVFYFEVSSLADFQFQPDASPALAPVSLCEILCHYLFAANGRSRLAVALSRPAAPSLPQSEPGFSFVCRG
jgi:hypothetical protein